MIYHTNIFRGRIIEKSIVFTIFTFIFSDHFFRCHKSVLKVSCCAALCGLKSVAYTRGAWGSDPHPLALESIISHIVFDVNFDQFKLVTYIHFSLLLNILLPK